MRHTISVLVENKFGVLTRVAGLFSGRGYNIDTLNVAPTQDANTSRMTIVTRGDDATLEQIVKQLNKLVDVLKKSLTIEITGNESKVEKFLDLMRTFGVLDLTRTGKVALPRK